MQRSLKAVCFWLAIVATAPAAAQAPSAPSAASIPDTVARVNGQPISRNLFLERMLNYHGVYVLENLIGEALLEAEAKKRGVTVSEAEIARKAEELKKNAGLLSDESFRSWLLANEWTENRYRDKARLVLLVEKTFAQEAKVTDAEVETYYNSRKADFTVPATATMWLLTVPTEEMAKKALELLRASKDFPTAAKELGAGAARATERAVTLPLVSLPPSLRLAVERAPLGQPSGPIKQPQNPQDPNSPAVGYQVIRVEAKEAERIRPFSEVREDIRAAIFDQRMFGTFGKWNRWLEEERQKATIERFLTFSGEPRVETASGR